MRNLKMTIQFDGSRYKGFENPKAIDASVLNKIETVLNKMTGEQVKVVGCGKTDVGVHAENYIANFHTKCTLSTNAMLDYFYEFLPEDIVVKNLDEVDERFHSRYNVKSKTYLYTINNNKFRDVFSRKYAYHIDIDLDLEEMKKAAEVLIGKYDFQSFTNLKPGSKSTIRTIESINITNNKGIIEIEMTADEFLLNMPRIIVGTLLDVAKGKITAKDVESDLKMKKRAEFGPIATSKALCLKSVKY
ncbi:tRNA pseudouridine38-40 synthase [Clostridium cavendishii DSM 21758]|uniref:tRNA pseudouridine synthase A n=1 Tax=Clostridium cavendishii DSM 21758 TaxID=1121302 RepID=A0A1M6A803_9CLOT|nr:tRNA pseudouridine(38-40) synthase TruA [Clostridium cavendishii]SHI32549.1 tRNA pseudouridine38-40 synthase [Clostridium cavendishii DSM 21758]